MSDQPNKGTSEIMVVRNQIDDMATQFQAALPAHIPVERFARVVMTAIQNNGDLLGCSRRSLFNAAMKAAQDGLLPDGREGAMVPYKGEVTWMPMVGGIRKKARNSGEIATWDVHAVFANDAFEYELGDNPFIRHKPTLANRGALIAVYSVATLKTGEKSRDVMSVEDVEKIRSKSRAQNGPWKDPVFYPEMAKKTVARRHSKVLPMSSDLDDLIRRDDGLYDLKGAQEEAAAAKPKSLAGRLDQLADFSDEKDVIDGKTGEILEEGKNKKPAADKAAPKSDVGSSPAGSEQSGKQASTPKATATGNQPSSGQKPSQDPDDGDPIAKATRMGRAAYRRNMSKKAIPVDFKTEGREAERQAWLDGFAAEEDAEAPEPGSVEEE
ncbi:recombinase RecT [Mesorhizobium sp. B1-1-5]|uniref:recombinase RecT n=1 Tax=Mesorhizobium sp. B1-1-5 TaxID=2589979 RepID=UPI001FF052D3|nr:recombinase RecT [Mesorhizobium sp. B1-1-5]